MRVCEDITNSRVAGGGANEKKSVSRQSPASGSRLLRRLPFLLALFFLAWLFLGDRPREITLVYDLSDGDAPVRATVRVVDGEGRVPALITWGTGKGPAADKQPHRARLAPGDYRLEAQLEYAGGESREIARSLSVGSEDDTIVLHLR